MYFNQYIEFRVMLTQKKTGEKTLIYGLIAQMVRAHA